MLWLEEEMAKMLKFLLALVLSSLLFLISLASPLKSPNLESRDCMVESSWFQAQRESRRILSLFDGSKEVQLEVYQLKRPPVQFHKGLFKSDCDPEQEEVYGNYCYRNNLIEVAITKNAREDYGSLVHEMIHSIAFRLLRANTEERNFLNNWAEGEWGEGSK